MKSVELDALSHGVVYYMCDRPGCETREEFPVTGETIDWMSHRSKLDSRGWLRVNTPTEEYDFCGEECMNEFFKALDAERDSGLE